MNLSKCLGLMVVQEIRSSGESFSANCLRQVPALGHCRLVHHRKLLGISENVSSFLFIMDCGYVGILISVCKCNHSYSYGREMPINIFYYRSFIRNVMFIFAPKTGTDN